MLGSYLRDYSDAYTVLKGIINIITGANDDMIKKVFKNNAPCKSCITKFNSLLIGNKEDLYIAL